MKIVLITGMILSLIFLSSCFNKNKNEEINTGKINSGEIVFSGNENFQEAEQIDDNSGEIEKNTEQIKENKQKIEEKELIKKEEIQEHNSEKEIVVDMVKKEEVNKETEKIEKELNNLLQELDLINNSSQN